MDRLNRHLAPISDDGWSWIDEEARRSLRHFLAARALVDFSGPKGWSHSAEARGRTETFASPIDGVRARNRMVTPVAELRTPFTLERAELEAIDRGASNPDLTVVTEAARLAAQAEDKLLFWGGGPGIEGMAASSAHEPVRLLEDYSSYPRLVAQAVGRLRRAGIEGPYGLALGDRSYSGVIETTEHGGYPLLEHIRLITGGPVIWARAIDGAVLVSLRGGDFELVSGADFAIGYDGHSAATVELYLEESLTFLVHEPKAAVTLTY